MNHVQFRQLWRIQWSLDSDSLAEYTHLHGWQLIRATPRAVTDNYSVCWMQLRACLRHHWRSEVWLMWLGQILHRHDEIHWLDVPNQVFFKLAVTVHWWLWMAAHHRRGLHVGYLPDYSAPVARANTRSAVPVAFCQPSTSRSTALPAQNLWQLVQPFQYSHPLGLELSAWFHPGPDDDRFRSDFLAQDVIYTSRAYAIWCQCPSVRLSVTEVHWRITVNLGLKFLSHFSARCGRRAAGGRSVARRAACGRIISRHASQC